MKKLYLSIISIAALSFGLNAQIQMDAIYAVPNGPPSAAGGNCNIPNMGGALSSGFLGWMPGDGSLYVWFDIAGTPGCGLSYPFTLEQVDIGIADPSAFGLPAGSGTGTLTFQINVYDAMTPGDPCTEPGALLASSGNQVLVYADEGLHAESVLFSQVLNNAFFVEWKFISWTGPGPEVPSPLWDDVFRPLCRQWITNDGGTTLLDMTDFFTEGDTGWVDMTVNGTGTAGGVNLSPNLEGFEGADFPPQCWNNLDEDGDGELWFRSGLPNVTPNSGDSCALSASWLDGTILFPENYLILPQVTPGVDEHLTYWVAAQDPAYAAEHYGIVVSTTGMAATDFSTELFSETLVDEIWVERTVDLSAYQGMDIYLAFKHYNVSDQFWMKIDDVQFPTETTPCIPTAVIDLDSDSDLSVFPNPTSGYVTVKNNGNSMNATIELLDMNGKVVLSTTRALLANGNEVIDIGDIAPGIYMIAVGNNNGVEMRKRLVVE